jgi:hopanoid biosynthesis associated protein HpnK
VNAGIERAFRDGILRSASLMAVGTAPADAAERARRLPGLGVGLHLTLVGERPLCRPEEVPSLVGREGRLLSGYRAFLARYLRGGIRPRDLRRELRAQAAGLANLGLTPDHLDSHQHLHLLPGLLSLTLELAQEHAIPWLRAPAPHLVTPSGHHPITLSPPRPRTERMLFAAACAWARNAVARAGLPLVQASLGFDCAGRLSVEYLLAHLQALPAGITELICHPGEGDAETQERYRSWGYRWAEELEALTDPTVREACREAGVRLMNWSDGER